MADRYHRAILVSCEIPWSEKAEILEGITDLKGKER